MNVERLPTTAEQPTLSFRTSAGALVRGQFERALQEYCDWERLELTLNKYPGWLETRYVVRIRGPMPQLEAIQRWLEEMEYV
ncbi:MAG: hypothetical protein V3U27_21485 [Candidatus Tectomicrobia bacterium]